MRGGRPFQNWSICMGYPSWTLLFLRRQNQRSCHTRRKGWFWGSGCGRRSSPQLTLKTNISRLKNATVLKFPSQMFGLPFPGSAGRSPGGRGGREWRSCLRSEVECVRRAGRVGNGLVGSIMAVGIPEDQQTKLSGGRTPKTLRGRSYGQVWGGTLACLVVSLLSREAKDPQNKDKKISETKSS